MTIQDIADDRISNDDSLALRPGSAFYLDEDMPIQDIADDRISLDDSLALRPGQNALFPDEDIPIQDIADDRISNDDSLALRPGQNASYLDGDMPIQDIADDRISNYDFLALRPGQNDFFPDEDMPIQDIADDRISNDDSLALRPGQNDFFPDKDMPLQEDHEMKVLYKIAKTTTPAIAVAVIEKHLTNTAPEKKLRVLFLIDWILSTIGDAYPSHFGLNIASSFCHAYEQLTEKDRAVMLKLRQTWTGLFDPLILYDLDIQVKLIDPQWPVDIPSTSTSAVCPAEFPNSQANSVTAGFEAAICDVDPSQASIPPTIEPPAAASHKVFPMPLNEELDLMAGTFHEIQENKRLAKTTALQEHERKIQKIKSTNKRTRKEKKAKKAKRPF